MGNGLSDKNPDENLIGLSKQDRPQVIAVPDYYSGKPSRKSRGQAMVELAFVLPLFLGLVFTIIEVGRAWAAKNALTIAAREGSRILAMPYGPGLPYSTEDEVKTAAIDTAKSYLNRGTAAVTDTTEITAVRMNPGPDAVSGTADDELEPSYSNAKRGDRVGIQINYSFETPLPFILKIFGAEQGGNTPSNAIQMRARCLVDHE